MKKRISMLLSDKSEIRDLLLYIIVGGIATAVEWCTFYVLNHFYGVQYILGTAIAFFFSTFVNWATGRILVFKESHQSFWKEISKIYLTSIAGFIINIVIMYIAVDVLNIDIMLAKIIATSIAFFWNFLIRKLVIYKRSEEKAENLHDLYVICAAKRYSMIDLRDQEELD